MKIGFIRISICFTLLFISLFVSAKVKQNIEPLIVSSINEVYSLNAKAKIYSTSDTLNGHEAWEAIQSGQMRESLNTLNPGMNVKNQAFWLYFTINNQLDHEEIYLEIDYPQMDYIQLIALAGDSTQLIYETGDKYTFSNRPVSYRNFILPISIKKGDSGTFLLNVDKRSSAIRFPVKVYSSELFLSRVSKENIYHGVYFGFFLLIFTISLLIGLFFKRLLFVWYSLYVLFLSLWIFSRLGYSYQFIIPNYPAFNTHFFPIITSAAITFLILYVMAFFETKLIIPKFHSLMKGVVTFIISFFFIWATIPDQFLKFAPALFFIKYTITFLIIVFAYTAAFKFRKIDTFRSNIFIGAYTILFLGIASVIFGEYGLGGSTSLIDPFMLGFFVEVMMLTFLMIRSIIVIISKKDELSASNQQLAKILKSVKSEEQSLFITLNSKAVIDIAHIIYIKSDDHYLEYHLEKRDHPEVDRNTLSEALKILPEYFIKTHRSFVVNLKFVKAFKAHQIVLKNGMELPISRTYNKSFKERMDIIS